jgi:predicted glycogen debranching enzyme
MIDFGRDICNNFTSAVEREWLVTNGIGGYAAGTVAGVLTRRYHGLLFAALNPPSKRVLLLAKLDEMVTYGGKDYPLFANHWRDQNVEPRGYHNIERFCLEGTTPVWHFSLADALLEKRLWMQPGSNTTYIHYELRRASLPLTMQIKALVNYRSHHANTLGEGWKMQVKPINHGLAVTAWEGASPLFVFGQKAEVFLEHKWNRGFYYSIEDFRGLDPIDDHLWTGTYIVSLSPGESFTLVASIEEKPPLSGESAYAVRREYEERILLLSSQSVGKETDPAWARQLVLAADQFIVSRAHQNDPEGRSIIAGYPWFGDWGRDAMISVPGLTLATGRHQEARKILLTFKEFVDRGMLPNRFTEEGEIPEYNTVDATLWYFEALRDYFAVTGDEPLIREVYPTLEDIVAWHRKGTRFNIHLDPEDGLLYAGEPSVQLTWMDAKVGDWVVTPRTGKPVEINALWYNALRVMEEFARNLGKSPKPYQNFAHRTAQGMGRFWNSEVGYCYDVLDGPGGSDPSLRPNQLFAVSLHYSAFDRERQKSIVDICAQQLYSSHGLRSLASDSPAYIGHYGGDQQERDAAYHQGTVWGWLIGPFISAHWKVYKDSTLARSYLDPLIRNLESHGVGNVSEIFDGDAPHLPRGCFAQAWSVAEILRCWRTIQ